MQTPEMLCNLSVSPSPHKYRIFLLSVHAQSISTHTLAAAFILSEVFPCLNKIICNIFINYWIYFLTSEIEVIYIYLYIFALIYIYLNVYMQLLVFLLTKRLYKIAYISTKINNAMNRPKRFFQLLSKIHFLIYFSMIKT